KRTLAGEGGDGDGVAVDGDIAARDTGQVPDLHHGVGAHGGGQHDGDRVVITRAGEELGRGAVGDDLAAVDDDGTGADGIDLFQQVGRDDDGLLFRHAADQVAHGVLLVGVEA